MDAEAEPLVRVVKGDPTDEELAALVAALASRAAAGPSDTGEKPASWAAYWSSVREPLRHGPTAWRDSARPRPR
ncbi:MAG: acyl-CoA carboxylase subunit epsilon [Jiangellaceae bacterium]